MLGIEITQQALFSGVVYGLIYAVFAAGFVLVYRCTGVLNFAQGEIGAFGVALFVALPRAVRRPVLVRVPLRGRRDRDHRHGDRAGRRTAPVRQPAARAADRDGRRRATAAVPRASCLPDIETSGGSFPFPFTGQWHPTGSIVVLPREILVLIDRAARDHRPRAVHDPDVVRAGGAGVGVELRHCARLRDQRAAHLDDRVDDRGRVRGRDRHPGRAPPRPRAGQRRRGGRGRDRPVAAVARARRRPHRPHAVVADDDRRRHRGRRVRAGRARRTSTIADQNVVDLYLFIAALVLVMFVVRNRRDDAGWSLSAQSKPIPERLRTLWYVRHLPRSASRSCSGSCSCCRCSSRNGRRSSSGPTSSSSRSSRMSIMPLAGWAGQLSLGQSAFVGLGALDDGRAPVGSRHPRAVRPLGHELPDGLVPGACSVRSASASSAALDHRHPRVARARTLPRRHHARLRGHVLELAVRTTRVHRQRVRHEHAAHRPAGHRRRRLLQPAQPVLPVPRRAHRHDARRLAAAPHGDRPLDDRRARQRGHGGRVDGGAEPDQDHVVRAVGRHRRARRHAAHHRARDGDPDAGVHARAIDTCRRDRGDRRPRFDRGSGDRRARTSAACR